MYMKARCSLVILNRMASVYPNSFMIANSIQVNRLQKLVDAREEIQQDLWTLASRYNENLKKKIATFPESVKKIPEETKENVPLETGAKAKIKAEEKRREAEPVKQPTSHPVKKEEKVDPVVGSKRNVTQTQHTDDLKETQTKR